MLILALLGVLAPRAGAQFQTCPAPGVSGPDVTVGDLTGPTNYTAVGSLEALAIGTTSCNRGTVVLNWISGTNQHPVIGGSLYRLKTVSGSSRFEQVGQSWLKHAFFALSNTLCCSTCSPSDGTHLGVGCSDPYTAARNGTQSGLGPKYQVNAHTGDFTYPPPHPTGGNNGRIQVDVANLEVTGATRYFGEAQYVTADDAANGNQDNNASYREVSVSGSGTVWTFGFLGSTVREKSGIRAWRDVDASVTENDILVPETSGLANGLMILAYKTTSLGGGQWHYEYALYNMNCEVSAQSFSVPIASGVTLTNIGFHDVDYLAGDGIGNVNFSATDWTTTQAGGSLTWATETFAVNQNANALRWGTTYNFRFDANTAPTSGTLTMGTFKAVGTVTTSAAVPSAGPPSNDNCAGATTLAPGGTVNGNTAPATNDGISTCDPSGRDLWYKVTTTTTDDLVLDTQGSAIDTVVSVYTSCGGSELACNDDCAGCLASGPASCLVLSALPPGTYFVRVSDKSIGAGGAFTLHVDALGNDRCCNARLVSIPSATAGTTVGSALETGLPANCTGPGNAEGGGSFGNTAGGVWYRVVSPVAQTVYADTLTASYDTKITVYTGSCGALTCVTINDDIQGSPFHSKVAWPASAGQDYFILVHGFGTATGTFTLNVSAATTPANDLCSSATSISGFASSIAGTTQGSSGDNSGLTSAQLASCAPLYTYFDVWYAWTAPCSGSLLLGTCGAFDTVLTVYSACPTFTVSNQLAPLASSCDDNFCAPGSQLTFAAADATTYWIRVATAGPASTGAGGGAAFTLSWSLSATDTDFDGTPDCFDGCPLDPLKVAPGVCGCGVPDIDTDFDGTADCIDGCPLDPLKVAPGVCGCGVPDTDTDFDGTADCIDGCPLDPLKIQPGQCGCGVPDTDSDGDGVADCLDQGSFFLGLEDPIPPQARDPEEQPCPYAHSMPVATCNGEATVRSSDLTVSSRGFAFRWSRTYSSRGTFDGTSGHDWNVVYDRRVGLTPGGISRVDGQGGEEEFVDMGGGIFAPPETIYSTITTQADGTILESEQGGMQYVYEPLASGGYLKSIRDRAGNQLTITRNIFHHIAEIRDTQDRVYMVAYTDDTASQRILSLTDYAVLLPTPVIGHQIVYTYDANGDLVRVRGPVVMDTPNGNDFPQGKTTLYTYSSGFSDVRLNHNLLSIVEPAYNVGNDPALSKPAVRLTYSPVTNPADPAFDRVISERWGHDQGGPPSNPNQAVGGTATFTYATSLTGDNDAPAGAARRTIETGRNGDVRAHYFEAANHEIKTIERTNRNIRPGEGDYATLYTWTADGLLASRTYPRGNVVTFSYDSNNPDRRAQGNLLERRRSDGSLGTGTDLVSRYTYEPVFQQLRSVTDPRAFPAGVVPLVPMTVHLDFSNALVAQYTRLELFDYQEGTLGQSGVALSEQIPNGLGDLNGNAIIDQVDGNAVRTSWPSILTPGPNFGDVFVELRRYNALGQVTRITDSQGIQTTFQYFATNGVSGDPSDREGYLLSVKRDVGAAPHLNLVTSYDYDVFGNLISIIDPKNQATPLLATTFSVNALNQVVRTLSRSLPGSIRYQEDRFYDLNDNLIEVDRTNLKDDGLPHPHATLVDKAEYNVLHLPVTETRDSTRDDGVGGLRSVSAMFTYDAELNRIAVQRPRAVSGADTSDIVTFRYDERGLLYKLIRGDSDTDPSTIPAGASVITWNYDANGNLLEEIDAVRNAQSTSAPVTQFTGSAAGDVERHDWDGWDRPSSITDGEGGTRSFQYDANSNRTLVARNGVRDHTVNSPVVLLEQTTTVYDELDRVVTNHAAHFDILSGANIGDGDASTQWHYDLAGHVLDATDDQGNVTHAQWDGAGRRTALVDALGNSIEYGYDANSNVMTTTRHDVSSTLVPPSPPTTYATTYAYDALDRRIRRTDAAGDVFEWFYDSRGNVAKTLDAVRGSGHPNGPGNKVTYGYDGLSRLVKIDRFVTQNGRGDGAPAGTVSTIQLWDDDSRLVQQMDHLGSATTYAWDSKDRLLSVKACDNALRTLVYDGDDHLTEWTDANMTHCGTPSMPMLYNGRGQVRARTVVPGPAVGGCTFEAYGYDGMGRVTLARSDDPFLGFVIDQFFYDSLGQRTAEEQPGNTVFVAHDALGNRTRTTYPGQFGGGSRIIDRGFDALDQMRTVSDSLAGTLATSAWRGHGRLERRTYANAIRLDVTYDALPRPIREVSTNTVTGGLIADFSYSFDRMNHRQFERRDHEAGHGDIYGYDSLYQVTSQLRNLDLSTLPPGVEILPENFVSRDSLQFSFDSAGNRSSVQHSHQGAVVSTNYTADCNGAYRAIVRLPSVPGAAPPPDYHPDGSLKALQQKSFKYDYKNRLYEVKDRSTGNVLVRYAYDAADRRVRKTTLATGAIVRYVYEGEQCIEERDGANALVRQYVWGSDLDELLEERTAAGPLYAHEGPLDSVIALSNASGNVVERYRYDPSGTATIVLNGATGNEIRFHGARFDPETGFYAMRARHMVPSLGRFAQRDPLGTWADPTNCGNAYTLAGNDAVNGRDPTGWLTARADFGPHEARSLAGTEALQDRWTLFRDRVHPHATDEDPARALLAFADGLGEFGESAYPSRSCSRGRDLGLPKEADEERLQQRLLDFVTAGLRAQDVSAESLEIQGGLSILARRARPEDDALRTTAWTASSVVRDDPLRRAFGLEMPDEIARAVLVALERDRLGLGGIRPRR